MQPGAAGQVLQGPEAQKYSVGRAWRNFTCLALGRFDLSHLCQA